MEQFEEGKPSEVFKARQIVFLAEVTEALRTQEKLFGLTLRMDVTRDMYNVTRRVVAFEHGEEVTTQNGDGRGSHGVYVHPLTGTPRDVAWSIAISRKSHQRQKLEAAKKIEIKE